MILPWTHSCAVLQLSAQTEAEQSAKPWEPLWPYVFHCTKTPNPASKLPSQTSERRLAASCLYFLYQNCIIFNNYIWFQQQPSCWSHPNYLLLTKMKGMLIRYSPIDSVPYWRKALTHNLNWQSTWLKTAISLVKVSALSGERTLPEWATQRKTT